jgi:protein-S-isoprenylcysteine O-methyltransferase Ste14
MTFRRANTSLDPRKPVSRFVTWGPYRYSRNPGYTSLTLIYVGISALVSALWPLLLLPGVLITMQRGVIEREERYLERRFGREYHEYKQRVRRWL